MNFLDIIIIRDKYLFIFGILILWNVGIILGFSLLAIVNNISVEWPVICFSVVNIVFLIGYHRRRTRRIRSDGDQK